MFDVSETGHLAASFWARGPGIFCAGPLFDPQGGKAQANHQRSMNRMPSTSQFEPICSVWAILVELPKT